MELATVYVVIYEGDVEGVFLDKTSAEDAMAYWIARYGDNDYCYIEESKLRG